MIRQEDLTLEVTETSTQALDDAGVTRTELARRLGRTPGYVSQVFGGGRNRTAANSPFSGVLHWTIPEIDKHGRME